MKATLSRLLSSKFEKSFIQPFIRYQIALEIMWLPIRFLVGISLSYWCCTTVSSETILSLFFFFLLFMLFLYTPVRLYVFSTFSPFVCSVRSSALNFYASHVSYLEHNSSQLEVSLSQKGSMRKNKDIPWKVIFSLFLSHVLFLTFVNTRKTILGFTLELVSTI